MPRTLSNTDLAAKQNRATDRLVAFVGYLTNPTASRLRDEFYRVQFTLRAYASFNAFGKQMKTVFTRRNERERRAEVDNEVNKQLFALFRPCLIRIIINCKYEANELLSVCALFVSIRVKCLSFHHGNNAKFSV